MKKAILVVDDDEATRITIAELLTENGYEVTTADDSVSGYRAASARGFDLITLDLMLDQYGTGADIVDRLLRDGFARPPVLLITGHSMKVAEAMFPRRVPPAIFKPFRSEELLRAVARLTGTRGRA